MLADATMAILMAPWIVIYGAASLLYGTHRHRNLQRVVATILVVLISLACGFVTYMRGLIGYTAYNEFGSEFIIPPLHRSLTFVSLAFEGRIGEAILAVAYIGAIYMIFFGPRRLLIVAVTFIISTSIFLAAGYFVVTQTAAARGILPAYFESYLIPVYLLFVVLAVTGAATQLVQRLPVKPHWRHRLTLCGAYLLPAVVLAGVGSWNIAKAGVPDTRHCRRGALPIRATPITDRLVQEVSVAPGKVFRGRVATFDSAGDRENNLWVTIGNDHNEVGLWHFWIPTLFQYNEFITPPYYLMLTEFLAKPPLGQMRNVIRINHPDETMLKLWGVRYIITDFDPGMGKPVLEMPVPKESELPPEMAEFYTRDPTVLAHQGTRQILTELNGVNLGDYSPVNVLHAADFASGLAAMREQGFDGRTTLIADAAADRRGPLSPATGAQLVLTNTGLDIHASSPGQSVLVLPALYSHCWSSAAADVELFRADLMQLGVRFHGRLDTQLIFRFGPFLAGRCRVDDEDDMSRLKIREARPH